MYSTTGIEFVRRTVPNEASSLLNLRDEFSEWLISTEVPDPMRAAVLSATKEAVSNAVRHAYRDGAGHIGIHATLQRHYRRLTVLVRDYGRWRVPEFHSAGAAGRGLPLIGRMTTASAVRPTATGTTVSMAWDM